MKILTEDGFSGNIVVTLEYLLNKLMVIQLRKHINSTSYEGNSERIDQENGFKPQLFNIRLGSLNLRIPKTRHTDFLSNLYQKRIKVWTNHVLCYFWDAYSDLVTLKLYQGDFSASPFEEDFINTLSFYINIILEKKMVMSLTGIETGT